MNKMKPQRSSVTTKKKMKSQTPNNKLKVQENTQPSLKSNGTIKKKAMKNKSPVLKVNSEKQKKKIALAMTGISFVPAGKVPISPKPEKETKNPAVRTPSKAATEKETQKQKPNKLVGFTSEHFLTLLDQIEKIIPVNDSLRPQRTIQALKWSKVQISGFTWMECKEHFMRIRGRERVFRTLREELAEIKELLEDGARNGGWTERTNKANTPKAEKSNVLEDKEEEMEDDDDSNEEEEESGEGEEEEEESGEGEEDDDDDDE